MEKEKKKVALVSVIAAVFLTGFKLFVGTITGSLGILSEALHSALDLVAAVITYFSVNVSDRPADKHHHFGHGKVENLSALVETVLLLVTCAWIIYEAIQRLVSGRTHIEVTVWSYVVIVSSILVDFSRSRALYRVAKKYNSQALEADALHFSTDIWSSSVVIFGLVFAHFGYHMADSVAALVVSVIVLYISYKLGIKAVNVLLDRAPDDTMQKVEGVLSGFREISRFHDIRVRTAGAYTFVEASIHVDPGLSIQQAHEISDKAEKEISRVIERCTVHIHAEPEGPELL